MVAFIHRIVSLCLSICPLHQTVNCPKENLTLGPSFFLALPSTGWCTRGSSEGEDWLRASFLNISILLPPGCWGRKWWNHVPLSLHVNFTGFSIFHWLANTLSINCRSCSKSPLCSGTHSSQPLSGQNMPQNPLRKLRLSGWHQRQNCPFPSPILPLMLLTCSSSKITTTVLINSSTRWSLPKLSVPWPPALSVQATTISYLNIATVWKLLS